GSHPRTAPPTQSRLTGTVAIEALGAARPVRVVANDLWLVLHPARPRARHDGLQRADLAVLERIRRSPDLIGEPSGEAQLVQWVDPVRCVVEFPVGMTVRLL